MGIYDSVWREKFEARHARDPRLYRGFRQYAFQLIKAGRTRVSHGTIVERLRWDTLIFYGEDEYDFKVNQNFGKPMAVKFVEEFPQHAALFKFKEY